MRFRSWAQYTRCRACRRATGIALRLLHLTWAQYLFSQQAVNYRARQHEAENGRHVADGAVD